MPDIGSAISAVTTIGGMIIGNKQSKAAQSAVSDAASAQQQQAAAAIRVQQQQFARIAQMLLPYRAAGQKAIVNQQRLLGLLGDKQQAAVIKQIEQSPEFEAMFKQGENAILQNASATGGLRGGNVQRALSQFRPSVLSNLLQQHFQNLGGLSSLGQSSAAMVGNAGQQMGINVGNLLEGIGASQAGASLAGAQISNNNLSNILSGVSQLTGLIPQNIRDIKLF